MKTTLIRGVPAGLQQDGWWLSGHIPKTPPPLRPEIQSGREQLRFVMLVALIGMGDVLVWQVIPGLSLAVFGAALITAAVLAVPYRMTARQVTLIAGMTLLILLPLVELVQPLSLLITLVGISSLLALIAGLRPDQILGGMARLWPTGIVHTLRDAGALITPVGSDATAYHLRAALLGWLLPLGLGGLFILLLTLANPIFLRWAEGALQADLPEFGRIIFWVAMVPIGWTVLSVCRMRQRLSLPMMHFSARVGPCREGLVNQRSVNRALVLFNAMFLAQTGMDVLFLYGGVGLPKGITYAEYAHRGAYPLLATALLAGGFALLTRRWTHHDACLRIWLMVWIAQNVALVISSLVRLDLYVGVYGLTHLRVWAAIWMGLVATGLGLVIWQVWRGYENGWLMFRCAGLGAMVLYVCAFVSFDAIVARYNTTHPVPLDATHLCNLGDAAQPYVEVEIRRHVWPMCQHSRHQITAPLDWREWGFRNWRARRSLAAIRAEAHS